MTTCTCSNGTSLAVQWNIVAKDLSVPRASPCPPNGKYNRLFRIRRLSVGQLISKNDSYTNFRC